MGTKYGKGRKSCIGMIRNHTQTNRFYKVPIRITSIFRLTLNIIVYRP